MTKYYAQWKDGLEVIWRNLSWKEYKEFKRQYDSTLLEEPMEIALAIYNTVLIKGPDSEFVPAGIPGYICKQQMINNPFSGAYEDIYPAIEMARRAVLGNYLTSSKALIAATLHYKLEDIDNWDPNTFFIRLAQTELVTGRSCDPVDPRAPKDSKGNTIPIKKNLSSAQQKAINRAKEDRARG